MNRYESLPLPQSPNRFAAASAMALWQSYRRRVMESDREFANALTAWENEGGSLARPPRPRARWSDAVVWPPPVMH